MTPSARAALTSRRELFPVSGGLGSSPDVGGLPVPGKLPGCLLRPEVPVPGPPNEEC